MNHVVDHYNSWHKIISKKISDVNKPIQYYNTADHTIFVKFYSYVESFAYIFIAKVYYMSLPIGINQYYNMTAVFLKRIDIILL